MLADPDPPLSARQLNSSPFSRDHADPGMHRTRAVGANLSSLSSGLAPWDSLIHCQRVTVADPLVSGISDMLHDPVIHQALERGVTTSLYIEEMFSTGHDAANRAVFAEFGPEDANIVGIALRGDRKMVDKITKGAKMYQ